MLTNNLMRLTIAGGSEWVMVLLLFLSLFSIASIVERFFILRRKRHRLDRLDQIIGPLIRENSTSRIREVLKQEDEPVLHSAFSANNGAPRDRETMEKIITSELGRERVRLERRLTFLGTLGNNAPFIGLFGTVLGIIRAFHDLSLASHSNTSAVMAGISEALVATAVGLFVAIPAVLFFNYFQRQVDRILSLTESLAQGILAGIPAHATDSDIPHAKAVTPSTVHTGA